MTNDTTDTDVHGVLLGMLSEIERAARSVARRWAQVTTEEDLGQTIYLHLAERPGSAITLSEMTTGQREASLVRIGHQIADQERTNLEYFSGQYTYSGQELLRLLEAGAFEGQGDSFSAAVADVSRAMADLALDNPKYSEAIHSRYVLGLVPERGSAGVPLLSRAVDALLVRMNRNRNNDTYDYENGGGRRKAISNVEALSVSHLDYDGEAHS